MYITLPPSSRPLLSLNRPSKAVFFPINLLYRLTICWYASTRKMWSITIRLNWEIGIFLCSDTYLSVKRSSITLLMREGLSSHQAIPPYSCAVTACWCETKPCDNWETPSFLWRHTTESERVIKGMEVELRLALKLLAASSLLSHKNP